MKPTLPTYETVAGYLEQKNGYGIRLIWWTIARMALIAPPMKIVGASWKQAIGGAAISSGLISMLTLGRIYLAKEKISEEMENV